ncbi:GNAT family N-acetyltransferase [Lacticaseibacillus porcinae]|uniref:GNAT family N-acetyltransferase n=1 Tax=Lacticaseibacillus porcinae TaxID=1123687 RepID=UPI001CDBF4C2|nr:GNAT family N-acetyltransferase [Lacticaseibacillus porcinae]
MSISIREAVVTDIQALLSLIDGYYASSPVPHTPDHEQLTTHITALVQPDNHFGGLLVAERNSQLVGFAFLYYRFDKRQLTPIVDLNDLYVDPDARRLGIARQLMTETFAWAKQHGANQVTWMTRTTNVNAQRLYDQVGVRETGWLHYGHQL